MASILLIIAGLALLIVAGVVVVGANRAARD